MRIKRKDKKAFVKVVEYYLDETEGLEQRIIDNEFNFHQWLKTKLMFISGRLDREWFGSAKKVYETLVAKRKAENDDTKYTTKELIEQAKKI